MTDLEEMITPQVVAKYRDDGVVHLPQALGPEWLMLIDLGIQRILNSSSPYKQWFFEGLDGQFLDAVRHFDITPEFQRLIYDSPMADAMKILLDSEEIWLLFDHVFVKDGGSCRRTPWHQDLPYWPTDGDKIGSMWITIDPIPKAQCLEFIPGSHKGTMYDGFNPADAADDLTSGFYGKDLPRLPDIESDRASWEIISFDIAPGDVVLLHPGVLHGGGQTEGDTRRRTLSVRMYGDDIVLGTRPDSRPTVPLTPGLTDHLRPGDPLRSPYYPKLRPLPDAVTTLWR